MDARLRHGLLATCGASGLLLLDAETAIPHDEEQPPHGSRRFQLFTPDNGPGPFRFKMQWIYDMHQLHVDVNVAVDGGQER